MTVRDLSWRGTKLYRWAEAFRDESRRRVVPFGRPVCVVREIEH